METRTRTIARLIKEADHFITHHDWDEAAVRCYQVLAMEPESASGQHKLRQIYLQRDLVDDMRSAVLRLGEPDDASPHLQRRRLAFSYRVLSRWDGWLKADLESTPVDELEEVAHILNLANLHGDSRKLLQAWSSYVEAAERHPRLRHAIQWWMAEQYAQRGFFADAAEVLGEMLRAGYSDEADVRYVFAEVCFWRDNDDCFAWLP